MSRPFTIVLHVMILVAVLAVMWALFRGYFGRKSREQTLYYFIKNNGIVFVLSLVWLFAIYINHSIALQNGNQDTKTRFIDYSFFTTIIFTVVLYGTAELLKYWFMNRMEDKLKLTENYNSLLKKYEADSTKWYYSESGQMELPEILCSDLYGKRILIEYDPDSVYKLPEVLNEFRRELFLAHDTSNVYNQLNLRVKDWKTEGDVFRIKTEKTTYYASLLTNRVMDFELDNGLSVRELIAYGPFILPLSESQLSNHLGFHCFLISKDNYVPFVYRSEHISVGKRTLGVGVQASLKVKYALADSRTLKNDPIREAVIGEIVDELKIPAERLRTGKDELEVIAAYRDMVEGGKPQLIVYCRSDWSKEEIDHNFREKIKEKRKNGKQKRNAASSSMIPAKEIEEQEDGDKLKWIPLYSKGSSEPGFDSLVVTADTLKLREKKAAILPSTAISVEYVRRFVAEHRELFPDPACANKKL